MAVGAVQSRSFAAASVSDIQVRLNNLDFELAFGDASDDGRGRTYQKHVRGALSESERQEMFRHYYNALSPAGKQRIDQFFAAVTTSQQRQRVQNLDFELAFGNRTDDGRMATYHKHVRGAQSEAERREMFAHMYTSLTWGGRANVTRFFGGQKPIHVPEFDAAVRRTFAGRPVPAYEVTPPSNGQASQGVVLAIHGGGWVFVGPGALRAMDGDTLRWNERGYTVVNVDYRAGAASVDDALAFYDAIRQWKPAAKVGATGQSAGGHLSMMIAARRPDLNFVVSLAGPSDLVHLNEGTERSRQLKEGVDRLWSPAGQVANSPALQAGKMGAKMLLGTGARDDLVPPMQDERMRRARPDLVQTMVLAPGDRPFIHAGVSDADYAAFFRKEAELAQRA